VGPAAAANVALAVPVAVLLGYGVARTTSSAFAELRSAIFSRVASAGIRAVARDTFAHLHAMDLKFHLNRNTGARTLSVADLALLTCMLQNLKCFKFSFTCVPSHSPFSIALARPRHARHQFHSDGARL
jgi:hypothetical protein